MHYFSFGLKKGTTPQKLKGPSTIIFKINPYRKSIEGRDGKPLLTLISPALVKLGILAVS